MIHRLPGEDRGDGEFEPGSVAYDLLEWYGGIGADGAWLDFEIRRAARCTSFVTPTTIPPACRRME